LITCAGRGGNVTNVNVGNIATANSHVRDTNICRELIIDNRRKAGRADSRNIKQAIDTRRVKTQRQTGIIAHDATAVDGY
jgi:hypothetical protein